jgi:ABC-type nitrate/sulfonate/bicarbonate transport system substrate-binding protein
MFRLLHVAVLVSGIAVGAHAAAAQEKVTYNMSWLPQGGSIGIMVAQDKGFFRDAGLDVNIIRGYGWAASNRAVIQKLAAKAGLTVGWIEYSAYGLNVFGAGIATREELLKTKPEMVRKFLHATYKGYEFAIAHPDEAADILVKLFPNADRDIALQQTREIGDMISDPQVRDRGLGFMRNDRMQSSVQVIGKAFELNGAVKSEDTFTNAYLK